MFQKVKRILGFVLLAALLISLAYIVYIKVTDEAPSFFGFSLIRVSSDSMEPELGVGEVVLIKAVDPATLQKGDVISYKGEKGYLKDTVVTHQISKEPYEKDGMYYFTTRGIKEGVVDDPEIDETQLRGKALYLIPFVGTVYDFFTEWYGIVAILILLVIAFGEDVVKLFNYLTKKDEDEDDSEHTNTEDLRQSESVIFQREKEFEGIITDLEDHDL